MAEAKAASREDLLREAAALRAEGAETRSEVAALRARLEDAVHRSGVQSVDLQSKLEARITALQIDKLVETGHHLEMKIADIMASQRVLETVLQGEIRQLEQRVIVKLNAMVAALLTVAVGATGLLTKLLLP